jgi:hypothetical protein
MRRSALVIAILALAVGYSLIHVQAENWPNWRGPSANGISNEKKLPVNREYHLETAHA